MKKYMNKRTYIIFTFIILILLLTTIYFGFFYKVVPKKEITPTDSSIQVQPKLDSNTTNSITELELAKKHPNYKNKYIQIVNSYQEVCKDLVNIDSKPYGNKIVVDGKYYDPAYILKEDSGYYLILTDCYEASIGIGYIYNNSDDFENYYQTFLNKIKANKIFGNENPYYYRYKNSIFVLEHNIGYDEFNKASNYKLQRIYYEAYDTNRDLDKKIYTCIQNDQDLNKIEQFIASISRVNSNVQIKKQFCIGENELYTLDGQYIIALVNKELTNNLAWKIKTYANQSEDNGNHLMKFKTGVELKKYVVDYFENMYNKEYTNQIEKGLEYSQWINNTWYFDNNYLYKYGNYSQISQLKGDLLQIRQLFTTEQITRFNEKFKLD